MKFAQKSIIGKVERVIRENKLILPNEKIAVAVSGGADSVCLLSILNILKDKFSFQLSACHFNHRLRGEESDRDEAFVKKFCKEKGIELLCEGAPEKNLFKNEAEARAVRYAFFEQVLRGEKADKIAIAHNQNDLAETLLFRFVRGSGLAGLAGMSLCSGKYIRPLLQIDRLEIEDFLKKEALPFCFDSTNEDTKFARNYLRQIALPALSKQNPSLSQTLAFSATIFADDYDYLSKVAREELVKLTINQNEREVVLDRDRWLLLHPALQRLVLRLAIANVDQLLDITILQLEEVIKLIENNVGRKKKLLPRSLLIGLQTGKITILKNKV